MCFKEHGCVFFMLNIVFLKIILEKDSLEVLLDLTLLCLSLEGSGDILFFPLCPSICLSQNRVRSIT